MGDGSHPSDWGAQTNTNLGKLEVAAAGATVLSLSGSSVTLTDDQARAAILVLNGILTSDQPILLPSGRTRQWLVVNNTSVKNVIFSVAGSSGKSYTSGPGTGPQGIYTDGTDVLPTIPQSATEAGFIKMYAGASLPANYLWCDGKPYSRTLYPGLFAAIGITYGAGDGTTTFNVPDYRGRVPMGADNLGGTAANRILSLPNTLGTVGGEEKHSLSVGEIPSHNHSVNDPGHNHTVSDPGHNHTYNEPVQGLVFQYSVATNIWAMAPNPTATSTATTGISIAAAGTGISVATTGGGGAHNNLQPLLTTNFVIHT